MRIAIFASGSGSNFQVLAERFPNNVKFIFSDRHEAYVLKRAEILNIPHVSFELKEFVSKTAYEEEIVRILTENEIDLVVLAGYMKIITPVLLNGFSGKIINIHPSYLPAFAGSPHAIEESHAAKMGLGVTVHYVDEGVDTGEVIAQQTVEYHENIKVYEERIHAVEHELYAQVIEELLK